MLEGILRLIAPLPSMAQSLPPASEVTVPVLPLMASVAALAVGVAVVASAFIKPAADDGEEARAPAARKAKSTRRARASATETLEMEPPVERAPLFKKAPFRITYPRIPEGYPDVWGLGDPLDIAIHAEDSGIAKLAKVPGLTVKIDDVAMTSTLTRGVMKLRKTFSSKGTRTVQVDLKVKGESLPRRTSRKMRVVDYREEMAEVFAKFRDEASTAIAPIPPDATPTDVVDILVSANAKLPEDTIVTIVRGFEEAKFSNHAVTRESYERMIRALLELERVEL